MTPRNTALALSVALLAGAGCGGGGGKAATTTSAPPSSETTSSSVASTTSSTIDQTLKELLLVAADLPGFKEATTPAGTAELFKTCDPAEVPAFKLLNDSPSIEGGTFERGKDDAVGVTSSVYSVTAEQAEDGLTELLDAKALECLEKDLRAIVEEDLTAGQTATVKLTSTKATVAGVDQVVILSATVTLKEGATTLTTRQDGVFLRSAGTILEVDYLGPTTLATPAERQKIVAVAARKLAAAASGGTTTTGSGGSSTSSTRSSGSSTTRRSTPTTRRSSTSTTTKATTTTTKVSTTSSMP